MLKRYYGNSLHVENNSNDEDEWVNIEETDWYREMKAKYTPASSLAFYTGTVCFQDKLQYDLRSHG